MDDQTLIRFLTEISAVRQTLSELSQGLVEKKFFKEVETNCGVYKRGSGNPEISLGIDAGLPSPIRNDLHSAGMSFSLKKKDEKWLFSGEIGWSSYEYGFDEIESLEKSYDNINKLLDSIDSDVKQLKEKYLAMLSEILPR
ncbi:MAG: hypothetical protein ACOYXT_22075 [Bacteroidota bacterium]